MTAISLLLGLWMITAPVMWKMDHGRWPGTSVFLAGTFAFALYLWVAIHLLAVGWRGL